MTPMSPGGAPSAQTLPLPTSRWGLRALFAAAGAFTLAAQTVLLREHLVVYGGNELGIGVFFASWLSWIALGAVVTLRRRRWRARLARLLPWLGIAYPLSLALTVVLVRSLRGLLGVPAYTAPPVVPLLALTVLFNAPVSLVTGLLFPAGAARANATAAGVAAVAPVTGVFAWEAAGAFLGGLLVTAALSAAASTVQIAVGASVVVLVAVAFVALRFRQWVAVVAAALALGCGALALVPSVGAEVESGLRDLRWTNLLPGLDIAEATDTPYQNAAIAVREDQRLLILDGRIAAAFPQQERPARLAALLAAQHPQAHRALVLGVAAPSLVAELLGYGIDRITVLSPDRKASELLRAHLPARERAAMEDPRVREIHEDPRAWLARPPDRLPFDLVVLDLPDPDTTAASRLFTVEAYRRMRAWIAPDAIVAVRLGAGENVQDETQRRFGASVLRTVREVFDEIALVPGEESWLLAGSAALPPTGDPDVLVRRAQLGTAATRALAPAFVRTLVQPEREAQQLAAYEQSVAAAGDILINRDRRPVAAFLGLTVWARQASPGLARVLGALRSAGVGLVLLPLLLLVLLRGHWVATQTTERRRRDRWTAGALMAAVGASAIALQLVILLAFQSLVGALYEWVGLLGAAFMLGLAIGAALGGALVASRCGRHPAVCALVAALIGGTWALLLPSMLGALSTTEPLGFAFVALATGLVSGVGFPAAGALGAAGRGAGGLAGALVMADHWGAALGAALAGVVLLPLLGRDATCVAAAAALAVPAVILVGEMLAGRLALAEKPWIVRWTRRRIQPSLPLPRLRYALLFLAGGLVIIAAGLAGRESQPRLRFEPIELETLLHAARFEARDEPFIHFVGYEKDGESESAAAAVAASMAVAPDEEGYGGPLNLLVAVDPDGRLTRVRLLESRETASYVRGIGDWLQRLHGRSVGDSLQLGVDVDALTGATVSSRAALRAVARTGRALSEEVFAIVPPPTPPSPGFWGRMAPRSWYLLVAFLLAIPMAFVTRRWMRRVFLGVNFVLGGLVFNSVLATEQAVALALGSRPGVGDPAAVILVFGALALAVLLGPIYCSLLCPLGAAQELIGDAMGARPPESGLYARLRIVKYLLLAVVASSAAVGAWGLLAMDPLQLTFALRWDAWASVLLGLILIGSALFPRFWCRALCPLGALLNLFNGVALLRRWRPRRRIEHCDLGVIRTVDLDCMQCNRCAATARRLTR